MCENRFYICNHCGNVIGLIEDSGVNVECCGEPMEQFETYDTEKGSEKHLPVVDVNNNSVKVTVGSVLHPMEDDHRINWVYLQTDRGGHRKCLFAGENPTTSFTLDDEKPVAV